PASSAPPSSPPPPSPSVPITSAGTSSAPLGRHSTKPSSRRRSRSGSAAAMPSSYCRRCVTLAASHGPARGKGWAAIDDEALGARLRLVGRLAAFGGGCAARPMHGAGRRHRLQRRHLYAQRRHVLDRPALR